MKVLVGQIPRITLVLCTGMIIFAPSVVLAQDDAAPTVPPSRLQGLELQPGDEPLQTFQPRVPRDDKAEQKQAAAARYMTGRIQQERGEFDDALKSFRAAIEQNPGAIEPYRSALPILLQKGQNDDARQLALAAAEQNETGFELILAMSAILARQDQMADAIKLLQDGLTLQSLTPGSAYDLFLHRDLGLYYGRTNSPEKSAEEYRIVFEALTGDELDDAVRKKLLADPGQTFDEFGDAFLKAQQPELALRAFTEASKYREAKPGMHSYNLATVFRQTGQPEKALAELQGYFDAQLQSRGRGAYQLLKELLEETGKKDELLSRLRELQEKDSHNDVLRFFLADEELAAGEFDRAGDLYTQKRSTVTDPRAFPGLMAVYRQQKNYEKLLPILTRAFRTIPRGEDGSLQQLAPDIRVVAENFERELQALMKDEAAFTGVLDEARKHATGDDAKIEFAQAYLLGKLAIDAERTADAIEFYKLAISMRNDPPSPLYTELGAHLVDSEHYEEAVDFLQEAVNHPSSSLQRDKWRFLFFLSYAQEFLGNTDQALESIQAAQQLNPSLPQLQFQEGWVYYHARRWDDALETFNRIIRDYSGDRDMVQRCRFLVSNIYVEKGDLKRGEEILENVLKEDPDNTQANNDLGYLWADHDKNLDRAEPMIRKALEKEPENPAYLDSMGWVLYRLGRYEEALGYLEQAVKQKNGGDGTIYDHLGDTLLKLDRRPEAEEAWKKAMDLETKKKHPSEKLMKSLKEKLGE